MKFILICVGLSMCKIDVHFPKLKLGNPRFPRVGLSMCKIDVYFPKLKLGNPRLCVIYDRNQENSLEVDRYPLW
jgi:hypothetical protein